MSKRTAAGTCGFPTIPGGRCGRSSRAWSTASTRSAMPTVHTGDDPSGGGNRPPVAVNAFWRVRARRQYDPPDQTIKGETMGGRTTAWGLRIAMWC